MTSVSAGHIILAPTQPVGSGRPQRESNPGRPHQKSRALPTELPPPNNNNNNNNVIRIIMIDSLYITEYVIKVHTKHTMRKTQNSHGQTKIGR